MSRLQLISAEAWLLTAENSPPGEYRNDTLEEF
jgi:hypothetical protein